MTEPVGVLGRIAQAKCSELDIRFAGVSLEELRERATSTERSLPAVIGKSGARFILEMGEPTAEPREEESDTTPDAPQE